MNPIKLYPEKLFLSLTLFLLLVGCNEDLENNIKDDPYGGGKAPLGIGLLPEAPSPGSAYPGDSVIFKAKGLLNWCDPQSGRYDFDFYISEEKTVVVTATDSTITIKVPENLSSGIAHIVLKDQVFYGPKLNILGNIRIDREYGLKKGPSGPIYNCVEHYEWARNYYLIGDYTRILDVSSNRLRIALINDKGITSGTWTSGYRLDPNDGANIDNNNPMSGASVDCYLNSFSYFSDNKVLLSGKFSKYGHGAYAMNNITVGTNEVGGYLAGVTLPSKYANTNLNVNLPVFNGGTLEAPTRTFVSSKQQVIAVGNITRYCKINYDKSYAEEIVFDYLPVSCALRMGNTGELDENYRKNATGVVGVIQDAYMDANDGVVIVGAFNSFDGQTVNNIVRLDSTGKSDEIFMQNIGNGSNGPINKIRYNKNKGKALLVGQFSEFNGIPCQGVVMLNADGTIDPEFSVRKMEGGLPNFACLLENDKIVLSGTFTKYDGVTRRGFLILDREGKAIQRFNVPGIFMGELFQVMETRTTTNSNGLLLLGDFRRFDGEIVNNAVMIEIDYD
ncbi:MAG: DUF5124 domain-containing protein [Dysgonamonadaceae bacterium]|jgi:hypothetical protein|nr:DUF5124 domain-containing protein [Dysgonamonadaceae bacterium]